MGILNHKKVQTIILNFVDGKAKKKYINISTCYWLLVQLRTVPLRYWNQKATQYRRYQSLKGV